MITDPLPIIPFRAPAKGVVLLPGSKSLTNRALILAALAEGTTELTGVLFSRDTRIMLQALQTLGIDIRIEEEVKRVTVVGSGGRWTTHAADFHIGNAGTAARFLTSFLALHPAANYSLDGDPPMRKRPMAELLNVLQAQGAGLHFAGEAGCFPFTLSAHGLAGGPAAIDSSASSQFVSSLLLAAPYAKQALTLRVEGMRPSFVRITTEMMAQFGVKVAQNNDGTLGVPNGKAYQSPTRYAIEPDVTAASYFLALPIVTGGRLQLPGLTPDMLQGDVAFGGVIEKLGATIVKTSAGWDVSARTGEYKGLDADFETFSDTFLTLAALSPLLTSPTSIRGIAHTRKQETDRVAAMARELTKLGCEVVEEEDRLQITPHRARLLAVARAGVEIDTYEDHRFAMSFGILGCADLLGDQTPWLKIRDPLCCKKTFPDFFQTLQALHAASHAEAPSL